MCAIGADGPDQFPISDPKRSSRRHLAAKRAGRKEAHEQLAVARELKQELEEQNKTVVYWPTGPYYCDVCESDDCPYQRLHLVR